MVLRLIRRVLSVVAAFSISFGLGTILFYTFVVLFTPKAAPFFAQSLPTLAGFPLTLGGCLLVVLGEWRA